jgi:hypothetical protein
MRRLRRQHLQLVLVAHIIGALIFYVFLEALVARIGRTLLRLPGGLARAYQDQLYRSIAVGPYDYTFLILMVAVSVAVSVFMGYLSGRWAGRVLINKRLGIKRLDQLQTLTAAELEAAKARLETTRAKMDRQTPWIYGIVLVLFLLGAILFVVDGTIRLNTQSSFHQYVTIITPVISESKRNIILADFASMRGKEDYLTLMRAIRDIANANHISLPPNKLYPQLWSGEQ